MINKEILPCWATVLVLDLGLKIFNPDDITQRGYRPRNPLSLLKSSTGIRIYRKSNSISFTLPVKICYNKISISNLLGNIKL